MLDVGLLSTFKEIAGLHARVFQWPILNLVPCCIPLSGIDPKLAAGTESATFHKLEQFLMQARCARTCCRNSLLQAATRNCLICSASINRAKQTIMLHRTQELGKPTQCCTSD